MASIQNIPATSLDSKTNMSQNQTEGKDHRRLPDESTLTKASEATILDQRGEKIIFGSLFENQKTVVVFIRHFFCGNCQAYVSDLAEIPSKALEEAGVGLVVVGCGGWEPIEGYKETTGFKHEIYADPSRSLYHILGMTSSFTSTPSSREPPKYLKGESVLKRITSSTVKFLMNPTVSLTGKGGDVRQNGGEFVFGPGRECGFASRMRNTEDHVEVEELMKVAGVELNGNGV